MLIKEGVWEGPFIELQRSLMGPRGGAGMVRMWQMPRVRHALLSRKR